MEKLTEEERRQSLSQLMESDDEDDDLGQPVFSQETNNSSSSNNGNDDDDAQQDSTLEGESDQEEVESPSIEEQAMKFCQYASMSMVEDVSDPSQLCWLILKNQSYPVVIRTNHDEAINLVSFTVKNNTLIKYLGFKRKNTGNLAAVPRTSLHPYNVQPKGKSGQGQESPQLQQQAAENEWASHHMDAYVKQLTKSCGETEAIAEKIVLQRMLKEVLENRKQLKSKDATRIASNSKPKRKNAFDFARDKKRAKEDRKENSVQPADEAKNGETKETRSSKKRAAYAKPPKPVGKQKLRAGDYVRYCHESRVAMKETELESRIISVYPSNEIAVELENGTQLPPDHQVVLTKRLIRGQIEEVPKPRRFKYIEDYKLDPSMNDLFMKQHQDSKVSRMKRFNLEVTKACDQFWSNTSQQMDQGGGSDADGDAMEGTTTVSPDSACRDAQKLSNDEAARDDKQPSRKLNDVGDNETSEAAKEDTTAGETQNLTKKRRNTRPTADKMQSPARHSNSPKEDCSVDQTTVSQSQARVNYAANKMKAIKDERIPLEAHLDKEIEKLESQKKKRRSDLGKINTNLSYVRVLKDVWRVLTTIARYQDHFHNLSLDLLLGRLDIEEELGFPMSTVWRYLQGDKDALLNQDTRHRITEAWEGWMSFGEGKFALDLAKETESHVS